MSEFDFSTLITDRTNADVSALSALMAKKLDTWTQEELENFNNGLLKGGYWRTDLNRVTACMEYLDEELRELGYKTGYVPVVVHEQPEPEESLLPDGYIQLEYIESTGTQYIDTGVKPNGNTRVHCSANFPVQETGAWLFGARDGNGVNGYGFLTYKSEYRSDYNKTRPQIPSQYGPELEVDKDGPDTHLNGNLVDSASYSSFSVQDNLMIGANVTAGAVHGFSKAFHRWYKIYDEAGLARDLIPCKNQSEVAGMYDTVEGKFYSSLGSTQFIAGPDAIPEPKPEPLDPYTWYESDVPTISQMSQYLANVSAIRSAVTLPDYAPQTPESMALLTFTKANDIESVLQYIETTIQQTVKGMARSNSFTFWSGNRPFPTAYSNKGRDWDGLDEMRTGWRNWQLATWYLLLYGNLKAEGDVS